MIVSIEHSKTHSKYKYNSYCLRVVRLSCLLERNSMFICSELGYGMMHVPGECLCRAADVSGNACSILVLLILMKCFVTFVPSEQYKYKT